MKSVVYAILLLPIFVTGVTFAWVLKGELALVKSMDVPVPSIGPPPETDDEQIKRGYAVFNAKGCVYCHGPNGAGGVKNANAVGGEIPQLNTVTDTFSEEELEIRILNGVKVNGKDDAEGPTPPLYMPAWEGHISDEELQDLIAFLMDLEADDEGGDEGQTGETGGEEAAEEDDDDDF